MTRYLIIFFLVLASRSDGAGIIHESSVAESVPFDNATNGFVATDVQAAIEESLTVAVGKPRYSIPTTHNGTVSNNQWLGYTNLLSGNDVPIRVPIASTLKEITFSFKGTSVDGNFVLYKNGLSSPGNVVATINFTNVNGFKITSGLSIVLAGGDYIVGRWDDEGSNPSDMAVTYFAQVL